VDLLGPRGEILSAARDSYVPRGLGGALTVDVGRVDEIDATLDAASVHARVCSSSTPPANVSHEPREISETSSSEDPSLR
jgi:hypothetical protein